MRGINKRNYMGKKKNKKFKHSHHAVISNPVVATQPVVINGSETAATASVEKITPAEPVKIDPEAELNAKYAYVRRDVMKLLLVILILAIIFVGIYILGQRTAVLANIGDWIYKVGHFSL